MKPSQPIPTRLDSRSSFRTGSDETVSIRNISKSYGAYQVLNNISFDLTPDSVTRVIERSGSGKSTLLRAISFLDSTDAGSAALGQEVLQVVNGRKLRQDDPALRRLRQRMGMAFQSFNLWPHRTAMENVSEGLIHVLGRPREEAREEAAEIMRRVGLADKLDHFPLMLSGGQQQRVAITRALASDSELILFDEPTSALDPELVGEILTIMLDLTATRVTMLITTHEMGFVRRSSTDVTFLNKGTIYERGHPKEVFERDQTPELKRFLLQPNSFRPVLPEALARSH